MAMQKMAVLRLQTVTEVVVVSSLDYWSMNRSHLDDNEEINLGGGGGFRGYRVSK